MWAIHSLPVKHRQTILLMLEELSHAEIAEILGITEINVPCVLGRDRR